MRLSRANPSRRTTISAVAAAMMLSPIAWGQAVADVQDASPTTPTIDYQTVVDAAYGDYKDLKDGKNADYIPFLAKVPSDLFAVAIVTHDGQIYGVGGGIVAIVPGRFAIVAFSPRLDEAGNSVRASRAIHAIACELGVGLFDPNSK